MLGSFGPLRPARAPCLRSLGWAWLLALLGCTDAGKPPVASDETSASGRGRIAMELPVGISVGIGGQELVPLPVEAVGVAPGSHVLVLASACQRVELAVDVAAGEMVVVDRERAKELEWATLRVTAKDREGKPLLHAVALGDVEAGGGQGTSETTVPACPYRVRVSSSGAGELGGVVEDIDFGEERAVERAVVLAPGPDMVRIPGGKFTLGPPEALKERYLDDYGQLIVSQYPVEVAGFEIDRSEVTAAQWMACRKGGGCAENTTLWWATTLPSDAERPFCNIDTGKLEPEVTPGREEHPMNCVARWQAEDYCRWAGKRLPTAIEWEYAARSGDDRTLWPWGNDDPTCDRGRIQIVSTCSDLGTVPVCSHPKGSTKQGVCDFVGNVEEYVEDVPETRPPPKLGSRRWEGFTCMGWGWQGYGKDLLFGSPCVGIARQEAHVGFRCARTIERG